MGPVGGATKEESPPDIRVAVLRLRAQRFFSIIAAEIAARYHVRILTDRMHSCVLRARWIAQRQQASQRSTSDSSATMSDTSEQT
jgi:hypothetical protein